MQEKRAQGRPARGDNEVGSQKIVEGMQVALRTLQTTNVTRKEIAWYAGVTPALVTYYFPERNALIEAATLPVVQALVDKVLVIIDECKSLREALPQMVDALLESYSRDAAIIELFSEYKAATPEAVVPDLLRGLDLAVRSFFQQRLNDEKRCIYNSEFLQKALLGMCKAVARRHATGSGQTAPQGHAPADHGDMICNMLMGAMIHPAAANLLTILPEGLQAFELTGLSH